MKNHFQDLFRYNDWANQRMLVSLEDMEDPDEKLILLYSHLLSAQIVWLNRVKDLPTTPFPLWQPYKLRELKSMTEESAANWMDYIDSHRTSTFEEMIFYKNTKGRKYESTIREIINQVIGHGSYHRGQMAFRFRELGMDPPPTDYIFYKRM